MPWDFQGEDRKSQTRDMGQLQEITTVEVNQEPVRNQA